MTTTMTTTEDMLESVGFEKSKIGSGDKELGYIIKKTRLSALIRGTLLCLGILGLIIVMVFFEVHFEKRSFRQQLRKEEHHAASKLAHVEMELWSQYHNDIHESHEAKRLMKNINSSYDHLQVKLEDTINQACAELTLDKVKAANLADRILHLVADMRKDNVKHARHLVDHLVSSGRQSVSLEKHVGKEIMKDLKEEELQMKHDEEEGEALSPGQASASNEEEPLNGMLEGFWHMFKAFESEFNGETRSKLKDGHPIYEALKRLHADITGDDPISEEEAAEELEKIDLKSVGAVLGSGRELPAPDIVEELVLMPRIPHTELTELERAWRAGEKPAVSVLGQLQDWHGEGLVPSSWLEMGVESEEDEDEKEEEREEEEEAQKQQERHQHN